LADRARILQNVAERDCDVEIFSQKLDSPFLLAPIGVLEMAHKEADLAVARAAAAERVPMIFSNQASIAMEECAAAMKDAPRWFQLYWSSSDELVASFVGRAEACGCSAIVVTLDTTLFGWRRISPRPGHAPRSACSSRSTRARRCPGATWLSSAT
jgi:lactate 2-monooxygenase